MKRVLCLLLTLLVVMVCFGQEKTRIDNEFDFYINAENVGTEEEPALIIGLVFKDLEKSYDSVEFVLDRADCGAMHAFFNALINEFNRMERVVRIHKVTDYRRPMESEDPSIRARWRTIFVDNYSNGRFVILDIVRGDYLKPEFVVSSTGDCCVEFKFTLVDKGRSNAKKDFSFDLRKSGLGGLVMKLKYPRIERIYRKANPIKPSKEELDALFDKL